MKKSKILISDTFLKDLIPLQQQGLLGLQQLNILFQKLMPTAAPATLISVNKKQFPKQISKRF